MTKIKRYDLHKNDPSKLHFEVNHAKNYLDKNWEHATVPHRHSFYQLIWFKEKGRHYVDFEVVEHDANSVFFVNKNQIHYFCPDSPNTGLLFHFNEEFINLYGPKQLQRFSTTIFNEIGSRSVNLSPSEVQKLGLISSYIESEIIAREDNYKEQVFHHFQTILYQVERLRAKEDKLDLDANADYKLAAQFKRLIQEQVGTFNSIESYADNLGTSPKTLTRISKKFLLGTPGQIIKETKLLEAKRILSNQKTSIKETAYALGFEDPTYFTKYFKQGTGITPKEFQKRLR